MRKLLLIFLCVYIEVVSSLYCFWNTGCPYKYFSSKTPYNSYRGDIRDSIVKLKDCEPVSIWGLLRHGKRTPGPNFATGMKNAIAIREYITKSYALGNSSLCAQDVENLRDWPIDNTLFKYAETLAPEGFQEMVGIASRFKQAFPQLFKNIGEVSLPPSVGELFVETAKGFSKGLKNDRPNTQKSLSKFDIMEPQMNCPKYLEEVRYNPNIHAEADKYKLQSEYLATKDRIQRRSGIDYTLTNENITALYDLCRYTWSGMENKASPWCALFTTEDLQVLEYIEDLRHYYRNAYGTPVNEMFGRFTLEDLLKSFQLAKTGEGKEITVYFTHSTLLDMVHTALGLFKDEKKLTSAQRNRKRKWRTSRSSGFGANFVAVLNRCNKNGLEDYNVVFYLNEEPLISICAEGVCSWQEFENKLKPFINTTLDC